MFAALGLQVRGVLVSTRYITCVAFLVQAEVVFACFRPGVTSSCILLPSLVTLVQAWSQGFIHVC